MAQKLSRRLSGLMIDDVFLQKLFSSDKRTVARAISIVEDQEDSALELLEKAHDRFGHAYRVGVTGPPGAGKSTIVSKLAKIINDKGKKVGIIAVDPTSPYTGGALLGDRIRMMELSSRDGIFIRSMATRGSLGGLSRTSQQAADVLDAAGYDYVFLETVGVGQSELDIVEAADTTVVILTPESGDSIQAMKAGLMEIADFFVINKADRPGTDQSVSAITTILQISSSQNKFENGWQPFVVKAIAYENKGIDEITKGIEKHSDYLRRTGRLSAKRKGRVRKSIIEMVDQDLHDRCWTSERLSELDEKLDLVTSRKMSPFQLAQIILRKTL
ncbi:MAG TPA: methylmalonyl Co-A mutase-associated GTPase MeaB [Candidatus Acidoferrales bacterium]|nr:methylmalonyl Co-A mutase-associated GTPase MeaB [Candidatus Acidoferrales bacterium]